jgi:hypothetical protein
MWGMDRYRVLTLQKLLRANLAGSRRAAVIEVLRRKVGVLANGARKRGKLREAVNFEAMLAEFHLERTDGGERNSRLREQQRLSSTDA